MTNNSLPTFTFTKEAYCPKCGHYNAMLTEYHHEDENGNFVFTDGRHKCRDCGFVALRAKEEAEEAEDHPLTWAEQDKLEFYTERTEVDGRRDEVTVTTYNEFRAYTNVNGSGHWLLEWQWHETPSRDDDQYNIEFIVDATGRIDEVLTDVEHFDELPENVKHWLRDTFAIRMPDETGEIGTENTAEEHGTQSDVPKTETRESRDAGTGQEPQPNRNVTWNYACRDYGCNPDEIHLMSSEEVLAITEHFLYLFKGGKPAQIELIETPVCLRCSDSNIKRDITEIWTGREWVKDTEIMECEDCGYSDIEIQIRERSIV